MPLFKESLFLETPFLCKNIQTLFNSIGRIAKLMPGNCSRVDIVGHFGIVWVRALSCQPLNLFYLVKLGSDLLKGFRMLGESVEKLKKPALEWASRNNPQNLSAELAGKGFCAPDDPRTTLPLPPSVPAKWMFCIPPVSSHKSLLYLHLCMCIWLAQPKSYDCKGNRNVGAFTLSWEERIHTMGTIIM